MLGQVSNQVTEQFDGRPWAEIGIHLRKPFHDQLLKQATRLARFRAKDLVWSPIGERISLRIREQAGEDYSDRQ
jgi:hypothetical protein